MLFMAALVAVSIYYIVPPSVKTHLGLDLQGGLEVVYTARTAEGEAPTEQQLDQTISILDRRVNGLGVAESTIQKQGTDQISVALPGIDDPQQALDVIGKTAQLEFYKDDAEARPVGSSREQGSGAQGAAAPRSLAGRDRPARGRGHDRGLRARAHQGGSHGRSAGGLVRLPTAAGHDWRRRGERAGRLRPGRQADRLHRVHRRRQQAVPGGHPRAVSQRSSQERGPDVRDRARQPDGIGPDDRFHEAGSARRHQRRRGDQRREHDGPGVAGSGPRAQHRRLARQARAGLPAAGLRDAGHATRSTRLSLPAWSGWVSCSSICCSTIASSDWSPISPSSSTGSSCGACSARSP